MKAILKDFLTFRFWRAFTLNAFALMGFVSSSIQALQIFYKNLPIPEGYPALIFLVLISVVFGLYRAWPRPIEVEFESPKTKIRIIKGDLLSQSGHLVVGVGNTFDTLPPNIISNESLQGQLLIKMYGGDAAELDRQLDYALRAEVPIGTIEKEGKKQVYRNGTVATLKHTGRRIFLLAYTEFDTRNKAESNIDIIWSSLNSLWKEIATEGNGTEVFMPVIGRGLARLSNILPAQDAIRLIVLSFMFSSRTKTVTEALTIVVKPSDYEKLDRMELQSFLLSLRPS